MVLFRPPVAALVFTAVVTVTAVAACHRPVSGSRPAAPVALVESHCWWAVFRAPLPPDSVAVRFVRAFDQLGLRGGRWTQRGDTAWAHAEPTRLADWYGGTYSARVVAFRVGDSTHFRHFIGIAPPTGGWPAEHDSVTADGRRVAVNPAGATIGLCGALGRAAQVHGTAPRDPDGEETLDIWTRTSPED